MSGSRMPRLGRVSGVLRATVVAAAGVGLVVGAHSATGSLELTSHGTAGANTRANTGAGQGRPAALPEPVTRSAVVCPGPEAMGVQGVKSARQTVRVVATTAPGAVLPAGVQPLGEGALRPTTLPGGTDVPPVVTRGATTQQDVSTARSVLLSASGSLAPGLVAEQVALVPGGDQRQLTTAACAPPRAQSWLLGGGAGAGRQERVVLANPGPNAITVDLQVLGAKGPVSSPNGRGIVVAPHGRTVVMLDAIAADEATPAVHVTAHGGEVFAALSDTWLEGTLPRGGETTTATSAPAREQVISALAKSGRPAKAVVRVAVPGETEAVVQTRVLTAKGPVRVKHDVVRVPGQSAVDIDLSDLPDGTYAVQVRADVPVVASALVERRSDAKAPGDFAWMPASPAITSLAGLPLTPEPPATGGSSPRPSVAAELVLAAADDPATVEVTTIDKRGDAHVEQVAVPADSSRSLRLGQARSVWVHPTSGTVRAGVVSQSSASGGTLIAAAPLRELPLTHVPTPIHQVG